MQIQSINLTNFRSFAGARVELPTRVTFLIGKNHAGKSSVIDAVALALTGHCRGTAADGKGADVLIRDGAAPAAMRVALGVTADGTPKPFTVERMQNGRTSTLAISGIVGTRHDSAGALYERLRVSPGIIDACLNTEAFLDLHHATAKNLLLEALDVRVPIGDESLTLAQVEQRYQHWFEERRLRKRALETIQVPDAADASELPDVGAIEQKLAALREEEKTLIAGSSEEAGRRVELDRQLAHARESKARLEQTLLTLEATTALDGARVSLDDAIVEVEERIATRTMTETEAAEADAARVSLVSADGRLRLLRDQVEALDAHAPDRGCVLNPAIECRTPAKSFTAQIRQITTEQAALTSLVDDASKTVEKARLRGADLQALERRLDGLQQQAKNRTSVRSDLATLTESLQRLQFERDQTAGAAAPSPQLQTVRDRIARGEHVVREARDAAARVRTAQETRERQRAAATALAEAERQADLYGPKGARAAALQRALATFHDAINVALARFGYHLRIVADPWQIVVNDRPAALLSKSERLQAGIALQLALAEASGFGFVAIDQVDLFDAENRQAFGALIDVAPVQVLAAATKDDGFEPPAIEGWTWVRVVSAGGISTFAPCGETVGV